MWDLSCTARNGAHAPTLEVWQSFNHWTPAQSLLELYWRPFSLGARALKRWGLTRLPFFPAGPRMNSKGMRPGKQTWGTRLKGNEQNRMTRHGVIDH